MTENERLYENNDVKKPRILFFLIEKDNNNCKKEGIRIVFSGVAIGCLIEMIFFVFQYTNTLLGFLGVDCTKINISSIAGMLAMIGVLVCFLIWDRFVNCKLEIYLNRIRACLTDQLDELKLTKRNKDFLNIIEKYLYFYKVEKDGLAPIGPLLSAALAMIIALIGVQFSLIDDAFQKIIACSIIFFIIFFLLKPNQKYYSSMILVLESVKNKILIEESTKDLKLDQISHKVDMAIAAINNIGMDKIQQKIDRLGKQNLNNEWKRPRK